MKLEITRKVEVKEEIDIDLPYYYSWDFGGDDYSSDIFGKIEEGKCTTIKITFSYRSGRESFEVETEECSLSAMGDRLDSKSKSTEAEYLDAKAKLLKAAQSA